ncbi:inovirus Gp2 family protein, partial [Escherichia coli]|nr:inovirus Gp2 family protein [Escherichia coli]EEW3198440.1 inovirus Gp2 family protein [Escherichia coli]
MLLKDIIMKLPYDLTEREFKLLQKE